MIPPPSLADATTNTRKTALFATISSSIYFLFNIQALGMQVRDIYETSIVDLLTDTSDEALAAAQAEAIASTLH